MWESPWPPYFDLTCSLFESPSQTLTLHVCADRQVFCDLEMRDIRLSRDSLLIEKCRQLDPKKQSTPEAVKKSRTVGKMFIKIQTIMAMRNIHFQGGRLPRGPEPNKLANWPEFGRIRHYRVYGGKGALEFELGTDNSMNRYIEPLRARVDFCSAPDGLRRRDNDVRWPSALLQQVG